MSTLDFQNILPIVLGAGQGTRMLSSLPKVMHRIGHLPMVQHVEKLLDTLGCTDKVLVSSPSMKDMRETLTSFQHAIQQEPLGTAHAVLAAESFFSPERDILVLYGDTPLITEETLRKLFIEKSQKESDIAVLGMHLEDPKQYGRLCIKDGFVDRIVEFKEATDDEKNITFCNSGIMLVSGTHALELLKSVNNNNTKGEFYLTDIIHLAKTKGLKSIAVEGSPEEFMGVNSPQELAMAERLFQDRQRQKFLNAGVRMQDPSSVYFSHDTRIEADVLIEPHVFFGPGVQIKRHATIKGFSHLEESHVGEAGIVGPFARLRPGTILEKEARVGNFVEVKKSTVGEGTKISHLTYIGDATLGKNVNIGAGTITCNYDGYKKHKTTIHDNVFIGSNSALVAPINIGKNALVGAGSTLTQDVEEDGLALSRKEQANIKLGAKKFRARQKKD